LKHLFLLLILAVNFFRFYGLSWSPPGFFVDEAAGASHAICIQQTGSDFTSKHLPLYSVGPGPGSGTYSAPYLYGEATWTSIVGTSPAGFRSFMALLTALTVLLIYVWLKKRTDESIALTGALLASISPWAFHFSRIAWDPPIAPFFILLGMVLLDVESGTTRGKILRSLGPLSLALASYAYPPSRIQVPFIFLFFGGNNIREKGKNFLLYLFFLIPMFYATWADPEYTARGKMLALWTYHREPVDFLKVFWNNMLDHLHPRFLLLKGDPNLRHSIQSSGMMSIPEWIILHAGLLAGALILIWKKAKNLPFKIHPLFLKLLFCAFLGLLPAVLTVEAIPHALRSIGAWPFFVMLATLCFHQIPRRFLKPALALLFVISALSETRYLYDYFTKYPGLASGSFTLGIGKIDSAFPDLSSGKSTCKALQSQ